LWGDGSGYIQHLASPQRDYDRYIVEEVPAAVATVASAVTPASPIFIAGLSMGGFGALRLGAEYPGGHEWPYWERHLETTLKFFAHCLA
jgi:putative tributyrin esterase